MNEKDDIYIQLQNIQRVIGRSVDQQEVLSKKVDELSRQVGQLKDQVACFSDNLSSLSVENPPVDLEPVKQAVDQSLYKAVHSLSLQPKSIVRKVQILLFPPQDARLFYRIVFGRWLVWLTVIAAIMYLYRFGVHWQNSQTAVKIRQLENDPIVNAWRELYSRSGKKLRREMDTILLKAALPAHTDARGTPSFLNRSRASPPKSK